MSDSAPSDLVVSCPPDESKTRQEFYHDTLVSTIMQRSGVPQGVPFASADVDFDLDLTRAYEATSAAREAFESLPVHIVKQFGSFPRLFAAMAAGQVRLADLEAAVAAAEKGGPASDSAPGGDAKPVD